MGSVERENKKCFCYKNESKILIFYQSTFNHQILFKEVTTSNSKLIHSNSAKLSILIINFSLNINNYKYIIEFFKKI